jgi:MarR family transcriptional regulator, organic hydroperoxide resistance regulator
VRPVEELRFLILAAQREGNRMLSHALRPLGITPAQAEVLRLLQDHQPLTLFGLGELLVCESGASPSRLVDRLVTAGLVSRVEAANDRRQVSLSLTTDGRRTSRRVGTIEEQLYRDLDAASVGHNTSAVMDFLRAFVADLPAGKAIARRRSVRTAR